MNNNQVSIEQAIALVETQLGSVFTKEDVINLINRIELPKPLIAVELSPELKIQVLNEYESQITRLVRNSADEDIIDYDSAEFSIGYGNRIEIDSISIDHGRIEDLVEQAISELVTGLEDEIYERDKDKEEVVESDLQIEPQQDTFAEADGGQVAEND